MLKRDELSKRESCLNRAKDDEMIFVLIGRDVAAPEAIRAWCRQRIALEKNKPNDFQLVKALSVARYMAENREPKASYSLHEQGLNIRKMLLDEADLMEQNFRDNSARVLRRSEAALRVAIEIAEAYERDPFRAPDSNPDA
jgi:hypothetical protein